MNEKLIETLYKIRDGAAFSIHLPQSGKCLTYEDICELAADAIGWEQGLSLDDILERHRTTPPSRAS